MKTRRSIVKKFKAAFTVATFSLTCLVLCEPAKGGGPEEAAAFQEIFAAIEKSEYEIHWQDHVSAYQSPNRAQNMRFTYLNDGFHVKPRVDIEEEQAPWEITMRLASYGKDSILRRKVGRPKWAVSENKARVSDDGIVMDYTSEERGVHQTFLVKEKPAGPAPLRLEFELELVLVDLKVNESENCAFFLRNDGAPEEVARYSGLQAWDAQFGISVAKAGNVNNDQFDDIIIGAPYYIDAMLGAAFVFHGGLTGPSASPQWTTYGGDYTYYGWCVASAGDVNGDQIADVIVGEPLWPGSWLPHRGRAKVYLGSYPGGLSTTPATTLVGSQDYCKFGYSVAGGGDVTGDGYGDVIIGAPYYDGGETDEGKVYVHYGNATGVSGTANWTAEANRATSLLGYSVGMGDLNSDDFADVFAGAPYFDATEFGTRDNGLVQVWFGSSTGLPSSPTQSIAPWTENNALFGTSVAFVKRFEWESSPAIVVGAPSTSGNGQASVWYWIP